ncbi:Iron-containing alcohol dehydrogenase [Elusimicrobium minutum Pei191]|uniref:Aldehyde-alcohol dehydrogenase n=1 Tax=Elusimicrobium minutum (strain Pei191) TaxID=445932 RepID=B2KCT1_ELUMP|nr:bifunctional acetaldehyde-CoA/alcohol dehydrogenase [Elusimicrobium minutum]ACC98327.1 Iron-containing alcohol dehydrogenase [Elusimicrobium minutum Pei191]
MTNKEIKKGTKPVFTEADIAKEQAHIEHVLTSVKDAQKQYAQYTQEQVDKIFRAAAAAAASKRIFLSKMAVEETGMGVMEDKVIKNQFASEYIYNTYKNEQTCGVLERDQAFGFARVAEPIGVIAGIIPTTNPTSTAIFKSLLALKTRNGIVFSPHPRAKKCTIAAAKIVLEAAVAAGAPKNIIGWIEASSTKASEYLMKHDKVNLILATGGPGMVKAAYSSGKPAIGVGAGNTPVVIDSTADIKMAVSSVIMSKTFDNGMICASEQSVIVEKSIAEEVKKEFVKRGCHFVTGKDREKLAKTIVQDYHLNSKIVGQSAHKIAELAGFTVDPKTKILIAEAKDVNCDEPFAYEKLSPVLAFYTVKDFYSGVELAQKLIEFGGAGHTSVLYTDEVNTEHISIFGEKLTTGRILINMPSSQGAIGDVYNFKLVPSLTLGCGSWGGNSVSENIGVKHLMNIKSVAERRENMLWFRVPEKIYFKAGATTLALEELKGRKRAFIITDKTMEQLGTVKNVAKVLAEAGIQVRIFSDVKPDPDLSNVREALELVNLFQPDILIGFGGGSPMDAAKIIWLMYEHPEVKFEDIALRFMDIRKRITAFPKLGIKATMVAIPTTSGTGSEVTPFTVITDDASGIKYPIADYELTPKMAIIDPEYVMTMPKSLTAFSGMDVVTHAVESYTSVFANNFTDGHALEALRLVFKYLRQSYNEGAKAPIAREKMHYAATIAGMAFANAFLGICHSMAHKIGGMYHTAHGLANAILLPYVIDYNATDNPVKQGLMPQYKYPFVKGRYAKIADFLGITEGCGDDTDKKVMRLIEAIQKLNKDLGVPVSLQESGIPEAEFLANLDALSEEAFDDQCTSGNPRYPLVSEIKDLYLKAYYGKPIKHKKN